MQDGTEEVCIDRGTPILQALPAVLPKIKLQRVHGRLSLPMLHNESVSTDGSDGASGGEKEDVASNHWSFSRSIRATSRCRVYASK